MSGADVTFRAMGSEIRLIVGDPGPNGVDPVDAVAETRAFIEEFEQCLSRFRPDSELCALNSYVGDVVPASPLLRDAVTAGLIAAERTGGLVDPTLVDEIEGAGYNGSREGVEAADLKTALLMAPERKPARPDPARRWAMVEVDEEAGVIRRPAGVRFDSGGIGKGLAADLVAARLDAEHVAGALVNLGGDLRAVGFAPDGDDWTIDLDPAASGLPLAQVSLERGAVATSTTLRRRWALDDEARHHLIDPATGRPAAGDLVAVSVLAAHAWQAEVLAKAALVAGIDAGTALIERLGADALLVDRHGALHRTAGFGRFELPTPKEAIA